MSELFRHFESPEDDDQSRRPDDRPDPPRDLGDPFDPDVEVVDRVARGLGGDDRPGLSPTSPVTFERGSVVDRLAGPREAVRPTEGRLALERLCNDLGRDLHDTVPQDAWEAADGDKRAELAEQVHAVVRDRYGLGDGALTISSELDEETFGTYSNGKVIANERLLAESTAHELIDTIAHENEHALQEEIMSGRREHPLGEFAAAEVAAWRDGNENYNPDDFMGTGYTYNPLEVDSRHAGVMVVEGYLKAQIAEQSETLKSQNQQLKSQVQQLKSQDQQLKSQNQRIQELEDENQALRSDVEELREAVEKLAADRESP